MMNFTPILCICVLLSTCLQSQDFNLDSVVVLQHELPESSGLIYRAGVLITHNDSGGGPYLYEIDTLTGLVDRTIYLANVSAVDWEDLAADDTYLYIGDFGNNFGARTNLMIYRLRWDDYWQSDTVMVDKIQFNYSEQTDFSQQLPQTTAFDAESLIAAPDGLYLFTKNWLDIHKSKIYRIPKTPGEYTVSAIDSIATPGLLTGLAYQAATESLLFVGYNFSEAFVLELSQVNFNDFSTATTLQWILPLEGSFKTEAVAYRDDDKAYLTKERSSLGEAVLYRLDTDFMTSLREVDSKVEITVFPNPVSNAKLSFQLRLPPDYTLNAALELSLLDSQGRLIYHSVFPDLSEGVNSMQLDVTGLAKGIYYYRVCERHVIAEGKLIVE